MCKFSSRSPGKKSELSSRIYCIGIGVILFFVIISGFGLYFFCSEVNSVLSDESSEKVYFCFIVCSFALFAIVILTIAYLLKSWMMGAITVDKYIMDYDKSQIEKENKKPIETHKKSDEEKFMEFCEGNTKIRENEGLVSSCARKYADLIENKLRQPAS